MYKEDLIRRIASKTGLTLQMSAKAMDVALETIQETMDSGESVILSGFGTFELQSRSPRIGRNPHTGEAVSIPARIVPSFKASKNWKEKYQTIKSSPVSSDSAKK